MNHTRRIGFVILFLVHGRLIGCSSAFSCGPSGQFNIHQVVKQAIHVGGHAVSGLLWANHSGEAWRLIILVRFT